MSLGETKSWPVCIENFIRIDLIENRLTSATMVALIFFCLNLVAALFRSKSRVPTVNSKRLTATANRLILVPDERSFKLIWCALIGLFRPRAALEAIRQVLGNDGAGQERAIPAVTRRGLCAGPLHH